MSSTHRYLLSICHLPHYIAVLRGGHPLYYTNSETLTLTLTLTLTPMALTLTLIRVRMAQMGVSLRTIHTRW
jgi:hypothetical protein